MTSCRSYPCKCRRLLNVATMEEPQFYGDYVLLTFPLRDPYDLEEVMDIFEDDMEPDYTLPPCAGRTGEIRS